MLAAAGRGADIDGSGSNSGYTKECRRGVKDSLSVQPSAAFDGGASVGLNSGSPIGRAAIGAFMARLTLRIDLSDQQKIGPGKIRLLEGVRDTGSIAVAGKTLGMSYRRAWLLVDALNKCFREPVVVTRHGGRQGGGAELTPFGVELIKDYRAIEAEAHDMADARLKALVAARAPAREPS
jgi:molybdate transport system regulatory protein